MTTGVRHTPESFWATGRRTKKGCLLYRGYKSRKGYGYITYQGQLWMVHRLAWFLTHGSLPAKPLMLDHLCRRRHCMEPTHLEPVTNRENVIRGRNGQREKTHCPSGHRYTTSNTRITRQHKRVCRTCHAARERKRRALTNGA